ncbi:MAG: hypothetical protein ACE37F_32730 [Nannocystaceae bacterium]|nr:hypothetical protein [bacterium]
MQVTLEELCNALQSALGEQRAHAAIHDASEMLGLSGSRLTRDQALAVLGRVAEADGLVGISARFARSRLLTRWAQASLDDHQRGASS